MTIENHPLKCPACGNILHFIYDTYCMQHDTYKYYVQNSIFWKCNNCNYHKIDDKCQEIINSFYKSHKGSSNITSDFHNIFKLLMKSDAHINFYNNKPIKFNYDYIDYYFFEGLYRKYNPGFLTPVYFNHNVIWKYVNDPNYQTTYSSNNTIINISNDEFSITLGINENNNIIAWLGDLYSLPENEQHYFKSENIDSDHNIASEFYDAQICVIWPQDSNEQIIFRSLFELNKLIANVPLYKINGTVANTYAEQIHPPQYGTENNFYRIISSLNKILVEGINTKSLKDFLKNNYHDDLPENFKSNGSIKTLQNLLTIYSKKNNIDIDVDKLISPLYVLYDFRILADHNVDSPEDKFTKCMNCLNLDENINDYTKIYKVLIEKLKYMFLTISEKFLNK